MITVTKMNAVLTALTFTIIGVGLSCCQDHALLTRYFLYTTNGKWELNSNSFIGNNKSIKLILSGRGANGDTDVITMIIQKYLELHNSKYHIIAPDYKLYFPIDNIIFNSTEMSNNVTSVARNISVFLYNLVVKNKIEPTNIHIVGSSLGAHMSAFVGAYFKKLSNQTIERITGLDPIPPQVLCPSSTECELNKDNANFADIIITSYVVSNGIFIDGHTHFLVNNGSTIQPGCENENYLLGLGCTHLRSNYLFMESIELNNFLGHCSISNNNFTEADDVYMGEYCKKYPKCTTYTVDTKGESPFGIDNGAPIS